MSALKPDQGVFEGQGFAHGPIGEKGLDVFERNVSRSASPLLPLTRSRVVDENATHRVRSRGEELASIRGGELMLGEQAEIGLVHETGRAQGVGGALAREALPGHSPQVIVEKGNQLIERSGLAAAQGLEPLRDLAGRRRGLEMSRKLIVRRHRSIGTLRPRSVSRPGGYMNFFPPLTMKRLASALALCMIAAPALAQTKAKAAAGGGSVASILETGELAQAYNPVLLNYLLDEGRPSLPDAQRRKAIDQLVTRFKEEMNVEPTEQVLGSAVALGGMLAGGTLGAGLADGSARVWSDWVDAALLLNKAGYKKDTIPFFRNCIRAYPYDALKEKCVVGLVAADPGAAFETLMALEKESGDVKNIALRLMGLLASQTGLSKDKKTALVEALLTRTEGTMNSIYSLAAIHGLALSGDPRAVEPIRKMTKGVTRAKEVERAAKRALLISFKDTEIVPVLEKDAKGGFGSNDDDKLFAGSLLIEARVDSGYAWAKEQLTKKQGGLSRFKKNKTDTLDEIVWVLKNRGGKKSIPVLEAALPVRKPEDWLSAYIAVALLDLGDKSGAEVARMALNNDKWLSTRLEAIEGLAANGDFSGLPVLEKLVADKNLFKKAGDLALGKFRSAAAVKAAVAGSIADMDRAEGVDLLLRLLGDESDEVRTAAAYAFGRMKTPRAVEGLLAGLAVDYGKDRGRLRSPDVKAHLLRMALLRFPRSPKTRETITAAKDSEFLSVRFMAAAAQ